MVTELKTIPLDKILPNPSNPREHFDKERLQELAESILSNGLLTPITVTPTKNGKYQIVFGERRSEASKLAKLKTIQAFVKTYKDNGQMMVESLIENVHREDLEPIEKAKYLKKIMEYQKISINQLAKLVKIAPSNISKFLSLLSIEKEIKTVGMHTPDYTTLADISKVDDKEHRIKLLKKIETEGVAKVRQEARFLSKDEKPKDVKKALLSDEINVEQAERISKLKTEPERKQAIQEHKNIAIVDKRIEANIEEKIGRRDDREFKKKLLQAGNWVASFRGGVTDSSISLGKTIKILLVATKFIPMMDDRQKETLEQQLDRFLEILERAVQLTEQIKDKI
jgi:ParB family chromosome partitioning protein